MNKVASHRRTEGGFTLLEMAIVIIIGGILLSFLGSALLAYMKKNQIITTEFRMEKIRDALSQYLSVNGHYPCAASRFLGPNDVQFGRMVTATCNSGTHSGTAKSGGVRIGAVPTRTLNLPDEFVADAWGHKFTYAVTEDQATNLQYAADGGAISVIDGAGNSLVTPAGTAHYVIISHGRTGDGSFPLGSATLATVPCPGSSVDRENCDDDATFRSTLVNSDANLANFYDDYAYFQGQIAPVFTIPPGAVMAFNLGACPDGWTPYTKAEGRFVVGSRPAILTKAVFPLPPTDPTDGVPDTADFNLSVGNEADGDPQAIMPHFVPLLYCEKV